MRDCAFADTSSTSVCSRVTGITQFLTKVVAQMSEISRLTYWPVRDICLDASARDSEFCVGLSELFVLFFEALRRQTLSPAKRLQHPRRSTMHARTQAERDSSC